MTKNIHTKTNVRKGAEEAVAGDPVLEKAVREARQMQARQMQARQESPVFKTPEASNRATGRERNSSQPETPADRTVD